MGVLLVGGVTRGVTTGIIDGVVTTGVIIGATYSMSGPLPCIGLMVKVTGSEVPPPGAGLVTVTDAVPANCTLSLDTVAVN